MKIHFKAIDLPFHHPFSISGGRTKTHQPSLIVYLDDDGLIGCGEAPAISYYSVTVAKMMEDLEFNRKQIESYIFSEPIKFWKFLNQIIPENPFLMCALDIAAWDLYGKKLQQPLYRIWQTEWRHSPLTDYTIGIDTPEKMVAKMNAKPWPIYKIKLGTADDIALVELLRKNTNAVLRIDANASWTLPEAMIKIPLLKELGVELIEQPLAKDDFEGMKVLFENSVLPLIADESCVFESDVERCAPAFHGINIKLTKCGGITPALRMIQKARQLNLLVMMGSMNECSIGSAAIANFIPQLDFVDADGPLLLSADLATGLHFDFGRIRLEGKVGLGLLEFN
jgi:L-alanine-DL-glutamate epimerase-like enolase superfamily enzyme